MPNTLIIKQRKNSKGSISLRWRLIIIFSFLIMLNIFVWVYAILLSQQYPVIIGLVALAYMFGLRHAVDADHIAAIDNVTRKLMQDRKHPASVGLFFSFGHSTVVILLSVLIAFSAVFVKQNLPYLEQQSSLIGTAASSIFLLLIGIINLLVLIDIIKVWEKVTRGGKYDERSIEEHLDKRGLLARLLKPFLKAVKSSWNMYFIGFLFGLGFDTASEVGLLSMSAVTGATGMPLINILILPIAFAAGMSLIDTLDGALMLGAYGWAYLKPIRKLYYNINITFVSVIISLFIGLIEGIHLIIDKLNLTGSFFDLIGNIDFGNLGYIIIVFFIASCLFSISLYKIKGYDKL